MYKDYSFEETGSCKNNCECDSDRHCDHYKETCIDIALEVKLTEAEER